MKIVLLFPIVLGLAQNVDRKCGLDLGNMWLDVVVLVDNSQGMTNMGIDSVAANIVSVFGENTRIGTDENEPRTTRVGLVTYNVVANVSADLDHYNSADDLFTGIFESLGKVSQSEDSYLQIGLVKADEVLKAGKKSAKNRSHYQQVIIIYASEYMGSGELDPIPTATRLRESGVTIITVSYNQDGDEGFLKDLAWIASLPYNFSNTDNDGNIIEEIQGALLQVNCFCPDNWIQYRDSMSNKYSHRYGTCICPVGLNAVWKAAKLSCRNRWPGSHLVTEFDKQKHDYVLEAVRNFSGFHPPFTYHIGLNLVNGDWQWDLPVPTELDGWTAWNPGYPILSSTLVSVLNQQSNDGDVVTTGWQNIQAMTTGANYVCETSACDTDNYCDLSDETAK